MNNKKNFLINFHTLAHKNSNKAPSCNKIFSVQSCSALNEQNDSKMERMKPIKKKNQMGRRLGERCYSLTGEEEA